MTVKILQSIKLSETTTSYDVEIRGSDQSFEEAAHEFRELVQATPPKEPPADDH